MELRVFNPAAFGSQGARDLYPKAGLSSRIKYVLFDLSRSQIIQVQVDSDDRFSHCHWQCDGHRDGGKTLRPGLTGRLRTIICWRLRVGLGLRAKLLSVCQCSSSVGAWLYAQLELRQLETLKPANVGRAIALEQC